MDRKRQRQRQEVLGEKKDLHREDAIHQERGVRHSPAHRRTGGPDEERIRRKTRVVVAHGGTYTPNMPRTQVTICGAPKEIAIPKIAAMHQPQEMRFAIAMPPSTMTRMTATGVSQARMLV